MIKKIERTKEEQREFTFPKKHNLFSIERRFFLRGLIKKLNETLNYMNM